MTGPLTLTLSPEQVEAIAERAAEIVLARRAERDGHASPWLYGAKAAAAYLAWPVGRVQKLTAAGVLPHHRVGQRCAYRRDELDRFLDGYREGRAR